MSSESGKSAGPLFRALRSLIEPEAPGARLIRLCREERKAAQDEALDFERVRQELIRLALGGDPPLQGEC